MNIRYTSALVMAAGLLSACESNRSGTERTQDADDATRRGSSIRAETDERGADFPHGMNTEAGQYRTDSDMARHTGDDYSRDSMASQGSSSAGYRDSGAPTTQPQEVRHPETAAHHDADGSHENDTRYEAVANNETGRYHDNLHMYSPSKSRDNGATASSQTPQSWTERDSRTDRDISTEYRASADGQSAPPYGGYRAGRGSTWVTSAPETTGEIQYTGTPEYRNTRTEYQAATAAPANRNAVAEPTFASPEARVLSILHCKNQEEIEIGRLAQQRGNSDSVRTYGEQLVRDHTVLDEQVTRTARETGIALSDPKDVKRIVHREKKAAYGHDQATGADGKIISEKQPAEMRDTKGKKDVLAMLRDVPSEDFDRVFAEKMQKGHQELIKTVEAARSNVSNDRVRELLDSTLPQLRHHEQLASALVDTRTREASIKDNEDR